MLGPEGVCPTSFADALDGLDTLIVPAGGVVTYCLWVANTGAGPATNVVVADPALGFTADPIPTLVAGQEVLAGILDVTVDADIPNPNTATVSGTDPSDPNGPALEDSDPAALNIGQPVLELVKTVVVGPNGTCPTTFAGGAVGLDTIDVSVGDTVTYCLWVANTGAGLAINVVVSDPGVDFVAPTIAMLAAGESQLAGQIDVVVNANTPEMNVATATGVDPTDLATNLTASDEAGIVPLGAISDKVFSDLNADGVQDPGEPGLAGVTVNLLDAAGNVLASTVTAADGTYLFDRLPAGDYQVEFVPPAGTQITVSSQGTDNAADSDADPTTLRTGIISLDAGEVRVDVDAGIIGSPVIPIPGSPSAPTSPRLEGPGTITNDPDARETAVPTLPTQQEPLAITGTSSRLLSTIGAALLAAGAVLAIGVRRRENDED